jgi:hypothetical protein
MSILRSPVSNEKFEKRAVFERFPGGEDKVSLLGRLAGGEGGIRTPVTLLR